MPYNGSPLKVLETAQYYHYIYHLSYTMYTFLEFPSKAQYYHYIYHISYTMYTFLEFPSKAYITTTYTIYHIRCILSWNSLLKPILPLHIQCILSWNSLLKPSIATTTLQKLLPKRPVSHARHQHVETLRRAHGAGDLAGCQWRLEGLSRRT